MISVPFIKIQKKTNGKIDLAKTVLSIFCLLSNIQLSESELTVLAYFIVYKISDNTKELILKSKVLATNDSLKNTMTKLRKFGLIKKQNKQDILNQQIDFALEPVVGVLIKIDNK